VEYPSQLLVGAFGERGKGGGREWGRWGGERGKEEKKTA